MLPRNHRLILVIPSLHNNKLLTRQLLTSWRVGKEPFYSYCFCACLPLRARPPSEIGEYLFAVSKPLQVSAPSAEASRQGTELCVWFILPDSVLPIPPPLYAETISNYEVVRPVIIHRDSIEVSLSASMTRGLQRRHTPRTFRQTACRLN